MSELILSGMAVKASERMSLVLKRRGGGWVGVEATKKRHMDRGREFMAGWG